MASAVSVSRAASSRTWSSYAAPFDSAEAKIVGFVVTPLTDESLIRPSRLPELMRSRDRSSSQMETPASARPFSRSSLMCLSFAGSVVLPVGAGQEMETPGSSDWSSVVWGPLGPLWTGAVTAPGLVAAARLSWAAATTVSALKPNCSKRNAPGALAP